MALAAGDTFVAASPGNGREHLYVVLHEFQDSEGWRRYVVVNLTSVTYETQHDPSCEVNAGDHPFVTHPSWAYYQLTEAAYATPLDKQINEGKIKVEAPVSTGLLRRLRQGLQESQHGTPYFRNLVPAQ